MDTLISLCMIVKNEELTLARCLESVQGLVDEIIIVDTGSTDSTKEIASRFGAIIYDFEWTKDFSAARNASIQKATGQWILVLDADEFVQKEEHDKFRDFLSTVDPSSLQCFLLKVMNIAGENESKISGMFESSAPRLFPNNKGIYYTRPIHEQLTIDNGKLKYSNIQFTIYHSGYTVETVTRKDKSKRNMEIFEGIRQKKQKLDAYYCYTLGNEYRNAGNPKRALYYYEKAYNQGKSIEAWMPACVDALVSNYLLIGDCSKALQFIQFGLQRWGNYSDYHTMLGYLYESFGCYDLAKEKYLEAINIGENASRLGQPAAIFQFHLSNVFPYQKLANIFQIGKNIDRTVFYLTKIINSTPQDATALHKLMSILLQSENASSIITFLEKLYPLDNSSNLLLLFRISVVSASSELAAYYFQKIENVGIQLGDTEMLDYALLTKDLLLFNRVLQQVNSPIPAESLIHKILLLAVITWGNTEHYKKLDIPENHHLFRVSQSVLVLLSGTEPTSITDEDSAIFTDLLIRLFELQAFEAFDLLMSHFSSPAIINLVADRFYDANQLQLAIDYYSILLENDLLHVTGYENLAHLHFNQNDIEQGLAFLEKALELTPANIALYGIYNRFATDEIKRKAYKEQFEDRFPLYKSLNFIFANQIQ
ncbi:tetratricopeptide repeat-containing glycosyltransferase family 2 protein [Paenibacillus aestuarii]|uniref:Glycosyltransferase n=1 Tax=Paenibacillus aestuarii TaxID=516965 RepID=A0ABW0K7H2_9BACL|nr:glycosyltransferase [Paenibacillus aestuarii]